MSRLRLWPLSAYDADFDNTQTETGIAIPANAIFCTVDVTGADVWLATNTSNASLSLQTSPATKGIKILKDWVLPFEMQMMDQGQPPTWTHFRFRADSAAAGHITVNFFR